METVSKLIYRTKRTNQGEDIYITISLDDECKNGHCDFSITGYIYKAGKPKIDKWLLGGGAIGDTIAKLYPEFEIFNKLHLSDVNGAPMYAIENGFYHMHQTGIDTAIEYLRITKQEAEILSKVNDKLYFTYHLFNLGIVDRWKLEAQEAIKRLEELTGNKFKDPYNGGRKNLKPLTEDQINTMNERINSGYYDTKNVKKRAIQAKKDALKKELAKLEKTKNQDIEKIKTELMVKKAVLKCGISLKNFIYYNHTNKGVFNWLDFHDKITGEQFNKFLQDVKKYKLPEGITFDLK